MFKSQHILRFTRSLVGRSTIMYLAIIMGMSVAASIVFYTTATNQLKRQLPPPNIYDGREAPKSDHDYASFDDFFTKRIDEGGDELLERLVFINVVALVAGGIVSYGLARITQRPVETTIATQRQLLKATGQFPELEEIDALVDQTIDVTSIPLAAALHKALKKTPLIAKKEFAIDDSVSDDLRVQADEPTLVRLFTLILQNAAQYSAKNTTIHLSAHSHGRQITLSIRDEGEGIAGPDLRHVTKEFYQADRTHITEHRVGHGLGLALAQALVQKNGGMLRIQSAVDQGTTVEIVLTQNENHP